MRLFPPLFSLPLLRHLPPSFRPPILVFISVATYLPMLAFWQTHGVTCMTVTGASMFPLLNGDADRTTKKDWVLVDMRNPASGLKRGMVVTFWCVRADRGRSQKILFPRIEPLIPMSNYQQVPHLSFETGHQTYHRTGKRHRHYQTSIPLPNGNNSHRACVGRGRASGKRPLKLG